MQSNRVTGVVFLFFLFLPVFVQSQQYILPIEDRGRWGCMDINGEVIVPLKYDYIEADTDTNLVYPYIKGYKGMINASGETIIPTEYEKIYLLSNQYFATKRDSLYSVWHYPKGQLDEGFESVLSISTRWLKGFYNENQFLVINTRDNLHCFLDVDSVYRPVRIDSVSSAFYVIKDDKIGIISESLSYLIPPEYDEIQIRDNFWQVEKDDLVGRLRLDGSEYIPVAYKRIEEIPGNRFIVTMPNGKKQMIDSNLQVIIPEAHNIFPNRGYIVVYDRGSAALYSNSGSPIVNKNRHYNYIDIITNTAGQEFIHVQKNGRDGLLDIAGNQLVSPLYSSMFFISENYLATGTLSSESNNGTVIVDINDRVIMPASANVVDYLGNDCFVTYRNGLYGIGRPDNHNLVSPYYDDIRRIRANYYKVRKGPYYGTIDSEGNVVIEPLFKEIYSREWPLLLLKTFSSVEIDTLGHTESLFGVAGAQGDILTDTLYRLNRFVIENSINQFRLGVDSGMFVVDYRDDGSLINKAFYRDVQSLNITQFYMVRENWWRRNPTNENNLWGLFTPYYQELIDYSFMALQFNFMNDTNLTVTHNWRQRPRGITYNGKGMRDIYGLVDEQSGRELLSCAYYIIDTTDFDYGPLARCVSTMGKHRLITTSGQPLRGRYTYVDDFTEAYTRVASGGRWVCETPHPYSITIPDSMTYSHYPCLECTSDGNEMQIVGGKWGLIDQNGNVIIEPKLDFIQKYFAGRLIVANGGRWGMITPEMDTLIPFQYREIRFLEDSKTQRWTATHFAVRTGDGWGVMDSTGTIIIEPGYSEIVYFENKNGHFFGARKGNHWGLLNEEAQVLIPFRYDYVDYIHPDYPEFFRSGWNHSRYGYLDSSATFHAINKFRYAEDFHRGFARVMDDDLKWRFIDASYNYISDEQFDDSRDFSDGMAAVKIGDSWGFVNTNGEVVIKPQFHEVGDFNDGIAPAYLRVKRHFLTNRTHLRAGYINKQGEWVVKPRFRETQEFQHGCGIARQQRYYFMFDTEGKKLLGSSFFLFTRFREITPPCNNGFVRGITTKRFAGLYSTTGETIIKPNTFNEIGEFTAGLASAKQGGKYGLINLQGEIVVPPQYRSIEPFSEGLAAFRDRSEWGYLDTTGKVVIQPAFRNATAFREGMAYVQNGYNGPSYFINPSGDSISGISDKYPTLRSSDFSFGVAPVEYQGGYIFVDTLSRRTMGWKFDKLPLVCNGFIPFRHWSGSGVISTNGRVVISPNLARLNNFSEGKAAFAINNQAAIYDSFGTELVSAECLNIVPHPNSNLLHISHISSVFYFTPDGQIIKYDRRTTAAP